MKGNAQSLRFERSSVTRQDVHNEFYRGTGPPPGRRVRRRRRHRSVLCAADGMRFLFTGNFDRTLNLEERH